MPILSGEVSAGDSILASEYNNLRTDLLTGAVTIAGVKTFSSIPVFSEGVTIPATKAIAWDDLDTYITADRAGRADVMDFFANGSLVLAMVETHIHLYGIDIEMDYGAKLYFDGGTSNYLMGAAGIIGAYIADVQVCQFKAGGIAPGNNEAMMWDVVVTSVDGGSPDIDTYAIDESKVYGIITSCHPTVTYVNSLQDDGAGIASWSNARINSNSLEIYYGGSVGAGDDVITIIFYVP